MAKAIRKKAKPKVKKEVKIQTKKFEIRIAGDNLNGLKLIQEYKTLEKNNEKLAKENTDMKKQLTSEKDGAQAWKYEMSQLRISLKVANKRADKLEDQETKIYRLEKALIAAKKRKTSYGYLQPARTKAKDAIQSVKQIARLTNRLEALPGDLLEALEKFQQAEKEANNKE